MEAIAIGDWEQVGERIEADSAAAAHAVDRLVFAHAWLARGRYNDAGALFFLATRDSLGLVQWSHWALSFRDANPRSATAHYVAGDALARRGDYAAAIEEFSTAIRLDPSSYLAYNGRGVARSIHGDRDGAYEDWLEALRLKPGFADSEVNLGVYMIEGGGRSDDAENHLKEALRVAPTFGLARNARACVLINQGRNAAARDELVLADSVCSGSNPFVVVNARRLSQVMGDSGALEAIGRRGSDDPRGFNLETGIKTLLPKLFLPVDFKFDFTFLKTPDSWGGVYLSPSSVEVKTGEDEARFVTDYLLSYPRGWVRGALRS